jgi:serum/glucocorticoid-regulated kinase 2
MEVDWWTIGTLIFEMLAGLPPFYDENVQLMYQKILYQPLEFPEEMSSTARSIITGLLVRDPAKRLGHGSVEEIKQHAFFKGLNWEVSCHSDHGLVNSSVHPLQTSSLPI